MWPGNAALVIVLCFLVACGETRKVEVISEYNASVIWSGEWMVEFYAPWCPACQKFEPVWIEFGQWASGREIHVAKVDVTAESGLSGRFLVTALPTIYHVKDNVFRLYAGRRAMDDLMAYVEQQKWRETEALTWWRAPSSPIMVLLGTTFKVSMTLRDVHKAMTEKYGIPTWAAYSLFALFTIIIGVAIGALIVFLADIIFSRQRQSEDTKEKDVGETKPGKDTVAGSEKTTTEEDPAGSVMRRKVKATTN